jgi:serine/threonine protein phosphatase 1
MKRNPASSLDRDPVVDALVDEDPSSNLPIPAGLAVYAIGDIHGRSDLLDRLHEAILADAAGRPAVGRRIVYLGDYIDRGEDSAGVIDRLVEEPLPGFDAVHLCGNHEDFLLRFLVDERIAPHWLHNGGDATLASYGVPIESDWGRMQRNLLRALPRRHLAFLENLALSHEVGDYLFVHAGIRPGLPLDWQRREDLLWIRNEFLTATAPHGRIVVHGHSIAHEPEFRSNRIGIDTGAYMTGRLTCLVLERSEQLLIQT